MFHEFLSEFKWWISDYITIEFALIFKEIYYLGMGVSPIYYI